MGTAIKHPVSDRVKPWFVFFDIRALWRLGLSIRLSRHQKLQMTGLTRSGTGCFIAVPICQQWASKGWWPNASRQHLRSARRYYLVPRHSLSSYGRWSFAVAGPTAWNSLSDDRCDLMLSTDSFRRLHKTRLFSEYFWVRPFLTLFWL